MKRITPYLFVVIVAFLFIYFSMPVLSYGFTKLPLLLVFVLLLLVIIGLRFEVAPVTKQVKLRSKPSKVLLYLVGALLIYVIAFPIFTSLPLFRSNDFKKLIGTVKNGDKISKHIAPISMDEIRVVDEDLAYLLGEKVLGSQPALGSQVQLGEFYIQKIKTNCFG